MSTEYRINREGLKVFLKDIRDGKEHSKLIEEIQAKHLPQEDEDSDEPSEIGLIVDMMNKIGAILTDMMRRAGYIKEAP